MKKSKFTEERICFALRQAETGTRVAEVCRKMGISDATCLQHMLRSQKTNPPLDDLFQSIKLSAP
jgi:putative transposase